MKMTTSSIKRPLLFEPKTTTTADYESYSMDGVKVCSGPLAGLIEDSIKECLTEEDEDGTLSKLITSIVLDKMFELSDMSEDELVETAIYKTISDKVSLRLDNIERRLSLLENQVSRLQSDRCDIYDSPNSSPYNYPPYTTTNDTTAITGSILSTVRSVFSRDKSDQI